MTMSETEKQEESGEFKLKTESTEFDQKNNSVFSSLAILEKKHEAYEKVRSKNDERDVMKPDPTVDRLIDDTSERGGRGRGRGRNAGRGRPRHAPYVPEYRREPRKWTMYDLSDVDPSLMTERSNKTAALSFLSDLKKRKSHDDDEDNAESSEAGSKVIFKKPKIVATPETGDQQSSSGKLVMPEYNFGAKKEKPKARRAASKVAGGAGIQLGHLNEEDDDDDG